MPFTTQPVVQSASGNSYSPRSHLNCFMMSVTALMHSVAVPWKPPPPSAVDAHSTSSANEREIVFASVGSSEASRITENTLFS